MSGTAAGDGNECTQTAARGSVVLVHGASHGGWCWRDTAPLLRNMGYRVFTPTLTGLGDRSHLRSPDITLETHIDDIVNLVEWEELNDVVLVAHSYGGTVITGACDRLRSRVSRVIFIDANTPENGQPTIPGLTVELAERVAGQPLIDGYLLPPLDPLRMGVAEDDTETLEWLRRRLTEQPLQTLSAPVNLEHGGTDGVPRTFILTTPEDQLQPFARQRLSEIRGDDSWDFQEMLVGHEAMITAPCETAELLNRIISGTG